MTDSKPQHESGAPPKPAPDAMRRLLMSAKLLQANSEGCAANHYGSDCETFGLPGWLADTKKDIEAAEAFLSASVPSLPDGAAAEAPVVRDTNMFSRLAQEPPAAIPEGYSAPLDIRTAAEIEHDRLAAKRAPPPPDDVRSALAEIANMEGGPPFQPREVRMRKIAREALRSAPVSAPVHQGALDTIQELFGEKDERPAVGVTREAIARIIEPVAFNDIHMNRDRAGRLRNAAMEKADAILALSPAPDATVSDDGTRGPWHFRQNDPNDIIYIFAPDKGAVAFTGEITSPVQTGRTNDENLRNAALIVRAVNFYRASTSPQDVGREATVSDKIAQELSDYERHTILGATSRELIQRAVKVLRTPVSARDAVIEAALQQKIGGYIDALKLGASKEGVAKALMRDIRSLASGAKP